MNDLDFAGPDNAPLWLPVQEQVDEILKNFYGQGIISAFARIAVAVSALVEKSPALPPAETEALSKFVMTNIMQPVTQLPKLVDAPVAVPALLEKSESEVDEEGWIGVDGSLLVLDYFAGFVREGLMAVAQAMETLAEP